MKPETEVQAKAEATQVEPEEAEQEVKTEKEGPSLEDLQQELTGFKAEKEKLETRVKDLSSRLTREQQEKAELYRFHKNTLPQINKKFEEAWEESPEKAVDARVEHIAQPISAEVEHLKAQTHLTAVLVRHPDWAKYESKVVEMGDEFPHLTHSMGGIEKLFQMARAEDLEKEVEKLKSNGKAEAEKARAFSEGSSPRVAPKSKPKLTPEQRKVAEELGLKEEDYIQSLEEIHAQGKIEE